MRTSLNEIRQCDDYLRGKLAPEEAVLFEAKLLINPLWKLQFRLFKKVHVLMKLYGRNSLKSELEEMHTRIFNDPEKTILHQRIADIFPEK